ncbi:MAG: EAL domain-containing protein [Cycloclasticus sp.]|nr:EAL domain-containing protein [Cycloclasticus sp.]
METSNITNTLTDSHDELNIYRFSLSCTDNLIWLWDIASGQIAMIGNIPQVFGAIEESKRNTIDFSASRTHPDDIALVTQNNQALIKGEIDSVEHIYRIKTKNGKWAWHRSQGRVYSYDKCGKALSIVFFSSFITEQKQLEKQLNLSTQCLNQAFSGTFDTVWDWNLDTDIIEVSDNWKEALGLDLKKSILLRKTWNPLIHPDDQLHARNSVVALLKGEIKYLNFEYRIRVATNDYYWILVRGHVSEQTASGKIKRIIGVLTNIDRLKKKEEELKQQDEQIGLAMLSTGSSLVEYNLAENRVIHRSYSLVNSAVTAEQSSIKMLNRPITVHTNDISKYQAFIKSFDQAEPTIKEARWRSKIFGGKYRWYHTKAHVVEKDTAGRALKIVGIRQDIHDVYSSELFREQVREREAIAYEDSMHAIWEWHPLTGYLFISERLIEKLAFESAGRLWKQTIDSWATIIHPDDRAGFSEQLESQIDQSAEKISVTYRIHTINNDWIWVKAEGKVVERNKTKKTTKVIGTLIEITGLKNAELELAQEKERAETTLESINDSVITTDGYSNIISINFKTSLLLGLNSTQVVGKRFDQVCTINEEGSDEVAINLSELSLQSDSAFNFTKLILTNKSGTKFNVECSVSPIHDMKNSPIGTVTVIRDVTIARELSLEIEHRAQHDSLTGIYNRHAFESALASSVQANDFEHILCYIDLDQFKIVNDTCGHVAGDELLRQLSSELSVSIRKTDVFARLGGDEFGVLMQHCDIPHAIKIAKQLKKIVSEYIFHWEDKTFKLGASIGLSTISPTTSPTLAMQHADTACFSAKEQGRNRIQVYRSSDDKNALAHGQMGWVPRLHKALSEDHFELYIQSIVDLQRPAEEPSHFEVLIRLKEKDDIIPPGAFLPAAERYNLSSQIDRWVIENTLLLLNLNKEKLKPDDVFNINLSASSLTEQGFLKFIKNSFLAVDVDPTAICFEITETAAVTNLTAANTFIKELKDMGCQFALDDFGSGLSSFGYLKNFPVDYLKIDGSFVKDILDDPIDAAMVKSINEIGHIMGKKTVAEWVENQAIADVLAEIGVNYAQGYHFSKPLPLTDMLKNRSLHT